MLSADGDTIVAAIIAIVHRIREVSYVVQEPGKSLILLDARYSELLSLLPHGDEVARFRLSGVLDKAFVALRVSLSLLAQFTHLQEDVHFCLERKHGHLDFFRASLQDM